VSVVDISAPDPGGGLPLIHLLLKMETPADLAGVFLDYYFNYDRFE